MHIFQVKQEILNRMEQSKVFAQNIYFDAFLLFSVEKGERMN